MAFETLGHNLLHLIKAYDHAGIPIELVRRMAREICDGLDFLHRQCKIIHTDLKPENVLMYEHAELASLPHHLPQPLSLEHLPPQASTAAIHTW